MRAAAVDSVGTDLLNPRIILHTQSFDCQLPSRIMTVIVEQVELTALFERLPDLVSGDSDLVRRGALCNAELEAGIGDAMFYLRIAGGRVAELERQPRLVRPWQFALRATTEAWQKFWMPVPEPGWHDLSALTKRGVARLEGDITAYMTHLQFFKDMFALPRRLASARR